MLNDVMPRYEFREAHHRRVAASVEATWAALTTVTVDHLTVTRSLVALRHPTRPAPANRPLLTDGPIALLHRVDGRVAIAGAISQPWRPNPPKRQVADLQEFAEFVEPGWTKYLTEFRIDPGPDDASCILTTETRGLSTDPRARHRFRPYWMLIRIPSGLIRRDILRAVAHNATTTPPASPHLRHGQWVTGVDTRACRWSG